MSELQYLRMHGCGNDYVFLDCFQNPPPQDPAALSRFISDRHRAVGSDGLVLMLPSDVPTAVARMRPTSSKQHRPPSARRRPQR